MSASSPRTPHHPHCTGAPLPECLAAELPAGWERLGDLALIPTTAFASPEWGTLVPSAALWHAVALALGVGRLARQVGMDRVLGCLGF